MNLLYQIWVWFIFVFQKFKRTFKPVFEYKITFWNCGLVLWIPKGSCVVKKLVWNVRIKAFWYTNYIIYKWWFVQDQRIFELSLVSFRPLRMNFWLSISKTYLCPLFPYIYTIPFFLSLFTFLSLTNFIFLSLPLSFFRSATFFSLSFSFPLYLSQSTFDISKI